MSIRVMTAVWDSKAYDSGTLLLLLALADWAKDDGTKIYPTNRQLMEKSRLSERGVRDCLARLKADEVIILVAAADGTRGIANEWRIDVHRLWDVAKLQAIEKSVNPHGGSICPRGQEHRENAGLSDVRELVSDTSATITAPAGSDAHGGNPQPARGQILPQDTGADTAAHGGKLEHERGQILPPRGQVTAIPQTPYIDQPSLQPSSQPSLHPPSTRASEVAPVRNQRSAKVYPEEFERVLAALPPCAGASKAKALKAWEGCAADQPEIGVLVDAAKAYALALERENAKRPKTDQRSACAPATWIEERRWESFERPSRSASSLARSESWDEYPDEERKMRAAITDGMFNVYFAKSHVEVAAGMVIFVAPSAAIADYARDKFSGKAELAFGCPSSFSHLNRTGAAPASTPQAMRQDDNLEPPVFLRRYPEGVAA